MISHVPVSQEHFFPAGSFFPGMPDVLKAPMTYSTGNMFKQQVMMCAVMNDVAVAVAVALK